MIGLQGLQGLRRLEADQHPSKPDFIIIVQRRWRLAGQPLAIEEGIVGAVLVFEDVLPILDIDASVQARDAALFTAMVGQVYIGEDVADSIFATNRDLVFAANIKFLIVGF